ncbi:uncharacterized protein LOC114433146 [Parambassis ranga]|uniref:Uncharacterized protein LOC114433146 n=1 Tax=Parambassis ranga TaxID=210632 RepID=A0A6P7I3C8_9TELE|nr:uncharacterized protein LOC114433146 [Parambassis ranga]
MGQPNTQVVDVESLRESGRRRGSCLDSFLVTSIVVLFAAVTAVAVGGVMLAMELRSELRSQLEPLRSITVGRTSEFTGDIGDTPPVYKMQNFAHLEDNSRELNNSTMKWFVVHYGHGTSVGSNFIYNSDDGSLMAKKTGSYFLYLDLKLECVHSCGAGILTVAVGNKLKCEVALQAGSVSESRRCWSVSGINTDDKLMGQMSVSGTNLNNWKLDSQIGMFLID